MDCILQLELTAERGAAVVAVVALQFNCIAKQNEEKQPRSDPSDWER